MLRQVVLALGVFTLAACGSTGPAPVEYHAPGTASAPQPAPGVTTASPQPVQTPAPVASFEPAQSPAPGVAPQPTESGGGGEFVVAARIDGTGPRLQCVPYAREHSGIEIRGDAWTWWRSAGGRYQRGHRPVVGSVLVFARTSRLSYGHLAVVTRVVDSRLIVVSHANWLNREQIHTGTPVKDVSPNNDWSQVRVWYTPGKVWGRSAYQATGFIYPKPRA